MDSTFLVRPRFGEDLRRGAYADGTARLTELELRQELERSRGTVEAVCTPEGLLLASADLAPRKAYLELTTECNLDCAMCFRRAWEEPGG